MALRNRWIVTVTDKHDTYATGPFCVMCRATCRVHSYHATLHLARKARAQANREYMAFAFGK